MDAVSPRPRGPADTAGGDIVCGSGRTNWVPTGAARGSSSMPNSTPTKLNRFSLIPSRLHRTTGSLRSIRLSGASAAHHAIRPPHPGQFIRVVSEVTLSCQIWSPTIVPIGRARPSTATAGSPCPDRHRPPRVSAGSDLPSGRRLRRRIPAGFGGLVVFSDGTGRYLPADGLDVRANVSHRVGGQFVEIDAIAAERCRGLERRRPNRLIAR